MAAALKFAFRYLRRSSSYSLTVISILALAIGVNTAAFTIFNGFFLRSLPNRGADQVLAIVEHQQDAMNGGDGASFSGDSIERIQHELSGVTLASKGGSSKGLSFQSDVSGQGAAITVVETRVSAGYFSVLGIPVERGREFDRYEDLPNGPRVAVITQRLWREAFQAAADVVGQAIRLKGEVYTVVGVAEDEGEGGNPDIYTPLRPAQTGECGGTNCEVFARLSPGVSPQQFRAQLSRIRLPHFLEAERQQPSIKMWLSAVPLSTRLAAGYDQQSALLLAAVGVILLISCANLAGLTLVQLTQRTSELATRLALGASRLQLAQQIWAESLLLAVPGGLLGLLLGELIRTGLVMLLPAELLPASGLVTDRKVVFFCIGATVLASILYGLFPALRIWRTDLRGALTGGGRSFSNSGTTLRQALVAGEVALTLILLAGAGLIVQSLMHFVLLPPGFDGTGVMTARISLDHARYRDASNVRVLARKLEDNLRQQPGVIAAGFGLSLPYERPLNDCFRLPEGSRAGIDPCSSLMYASAGYFRTLHIPTLKGRVITDDDKSDSLPVAIVSESFARRQFGKAYAIGRHLVLGKTTTFTIVGVVGNVKYGSGMTRMKLGAEPMLYVPVTQIPPEYMEEAHLWYRPALLVRVHPGSTNAGLLLTQAVQRADPSLAASVPDSLEQILNLALQKERIQATFLSALAALALILSTLGIYAQVSYLVSLRRRDVGIRLALGSPLSRVVQSQMSTGLTAALWGLGAGLPGAFLCLHLLRSSVSGVAGIDPMILGLEALGLALIAALASAIPASMAASISPAIVLRSE